MSIRCDCREPRYCICDLEREREEGARQEREKIAAWLESRAENVEINGRVYAMVPLSWFGRVRIGEHNK